MTPNLIFPPFIRLLVMYLYKFWLKVEVAGWCMGRVGSMMFIMAILAVKHDVCNVLYSEQIICSIMNLFLHMSLYIQIEVLYTKGSTCTR